ncbi:CocE/NonD family hydrolase [Candidatus Dormiibacter inghamiae]|uniref:CocE/NonD family hydrolase n=1 Tax=Candidatus Dormiibacter inghamiae TaxID=3127013 RepID=UPI0030C7057F
MAWSPYGRQLQRTDVPIPQNEAGITEFWVPRGYAHVIADARGSNDSAGDWDLMGPVEQRDLGQLIKQVAAQSWCNGRVGMAGCSYVGVSQYLAARQQPPSLRAIFPHDAFTDQYRECFFHGGIPAEGFQRDWSSAVSILSMWSGRRSEISGMQRHFNRILGLEEPFDWPYYQERSAWPDLERIQVPGYYGTNWRYTDLHLRGAFQAYGSAGDPHRRLLLGPLPSVRRPFATYHVEALHWYDQWLKDLDTGVMDGDPIRIWVQGEERWRGEPEWPLARTRWTELFLAGRETGREGILDTTPGHPGARTYHYDPSDERAWVGGEPRLVYRTPPLEADLEVRGTNGANPMGNDQRRRFRLADLGV